MPVSPLLATDPVTIGPYSLLGRVAAGGMGVAYLGRENGRPDSLVVVKTARRDIGVPAELLERLRREACTTAELARAAVPPEGLARFVGADADADTPWIATEYIPGPSLHEAGRVEVLRVPELTVLARMLAETISAMHRAGYAHRDVKPANVVLGPEGARLVDLGLARRVGEPDDALALGSPGWSPPEQRESGREPRPGDVHGWAMSVAYAASGRSPFGSGPPALVTRRMLTVRPRLVGLPDSLRDVVVAALHPDPHARPRAVDVVASLDALPDPVVTCALGPAASDCHHTQGADRPSQATRTTELAPPTLIESHPPGPSQTPDGVGAWWSRQRGAVAAAACVVMALAALVIGTESAMAPSTPRPATARPAPSAPTPVASRPTSRVTPVALASTPARPTPAVSRASTASAAAHGKSKHHKRKR